MPNRDVFYVGDPTSSIRFERFLRLFAGTHDRELAWPAQVLEAKRCAAPLMHRKPLTMDQIPLPERQQFAITRRPRLSCFQRGAFGFADRDHLFCMRARQLPPAGQSTAPGDGSEILAHVLLRFLHFNGHQSCIISG